MPRRLDKGKYLPDEGTPYLALNAEIKETFKFAGMLAQEFFTNPPKNALDVGCANGSLHEFLSEIFHKTEFTGIDTTAEFIKVANSIGLDNCKFLTTNLESFFLASKEKFDLVTCIGTLSMFDNPIESITHLIKLTKPKSGLLLIETNFNFSNYDVRIEYRKSTKDQKSEFQYGLDAISVGQIQSTLNDLGINHFFRKMPFIKDIPRLPDSNIPRWYTVNHPIKQGEKWIVNDIGMYMEHTFLVVTP